MSKQNPQTVSSNESANYSDEEDSDLFLNLAPVNQKKSSQNNFNNQSHSILAKMKRLIGDVYMTKTINDCTKKHTKSQKANTNKSVKTKAFYPQSDSYEENRDSSVSNKERERSRDKCDKQRPDKYIEKDPEERVHSAAILLIQKQTIKQNMKSTINQLSNKKNEQKDNVKFDKFAQIEKQLLIPIDELPILPKKTLQEQKEEKNAKKRLDRLMVKKYKEYKVGKVRDETSNCVFNGIEDYFM